MDLLSTQDFNDIRSAINDVCDTFFKKVIAYKMDTNTVTRWNRDVKNSRIYTTVTLNGLVVWEKTGAGSETKQTAQGGYDIDKGYVLIKFDDAQTAGVIDTNKQILLHPPQDGITIDGVTYNVVGVNLIGQLADKECLLKVHIQKVPLQENGQ